MRSIPRTKKSFVGERFVGFSAGLGQFLADELKAD
jgi:hypothetical protein